jgi:phenylalanyl-tRNA synthetase beta chain
VKIPLSWLRDFAPFGDDVDGLAASLSELGLVVEGVDRVGEGLEGVIVARVVSTRVHPDADKVQLVEVDTGAGDGATRQIVCGAFNFGPGDLVPLATIGARLPDGPGHQGMEIARRNVRGQWSEGMLCSPSELGLVDDHSGIMIVEADGAVPGMALADAIGIRPDAVFDLDITPNRPDALSVAGVARDLAAHYRLPFALPAPPPLAPDDGTAPATIAVADTDTDLSARFTGVVIRGITVGPSPAWLAGRLTMAGMRPISNVVDVSNYVMLELGQPNHAYDLDQLPGGGLLVRRGRAGETVVTLDQVERAVGPDDCLICDAESMPVGVGGIMGGASSEISGATTTVLLETAWFRPVAIARTSKRLGLRSEASVRFERGVDPEGVGRAAARFVEIISQVTGAQVVGGLIDVTDFAQLPGPVTVPVRTARVNAILGTDLTSDQVRGYLEPIGFGTGASENGTFDVTIPTWRPDSSREIDVIEEVARHHGYSRIPRTRPPVAAVGRLDGYQRDRRLVADILVGAGLSEAWATSFLESADLVRCGLPPEAIEVENPLAAEESILRPSLLPGLLKALVTNTSHRRPHVALFEIGHVFLPPPPGARLPDEPEHLAVVLAGRDAPEAVRTWRGLAEGLRLDDIRLRASTGSGLHPSRTADLVAGGPDGQVLGAVGEVDPGVLAAHQLEGPVGWIQVDLGLLLRSAPRRPSTYRPISRFPSADIDLAFVVDDAVPAGDVERALRAAGGDLLERLELFDVYRGDGVGDGRRSLAYHLRLSTLDHTLTEDELARIRRQCIEAVESACGGRLRG